MELIKRNCRLSFTDPAATSKRVFVFDGNSNGMLQNKIEFQYITFVLFCVV